MSLTIAATRDTASVASKLYGRGRHNGCLSTDGENVSQAEVAPLWALICVDDALRRVLSLEYHWHSAYR